MDLGRATPPLLKHLNERTVLEAIRAGAPISRAEISRRVGISKPTVSLALRSLEEAGLVRETPHGPDGPSYGALFFEPVPDAAFVLGLDLGSRFLRGAVADLAGQIRARQDVELRGADADGAMEAITTLHAALIAGASLPVERIDGVVLGIPGVVENGGTLRLTTPHIAGLEGRAFANEVGARLGVGVTLDNDINLAAVGERWAGVARGVDDFAFLSIGTGTGLGLVLNGELHRGKHGAAGEIDWALIGADGTADPSAEGIEALAAELGWDNRARASSASPPYDARDIFTAARRDNPLARAIVERIAQRIAAHVAPVAAVADPELVVLGGGIGMNGDLLLEPVRALLRDWLPYPPRVEISSLGESAVLMGAVATGLQSALDNVFVNRPTALRATEA
jgi:predicted NBD/HSP70 family sugar kinase